MQKDSRFVGLDVHAETIAVAVAERGGAVRALGVIPHRAEAIRRLVKRLGPVQRLHAWYEAGPCGYVLYSTGSSPSSGCGATWSPRLWFPGRPASG